jgi:hypothetical protein
MDKISVFAFCALYIAIVISLFTEIPQDNWMPHIVIGLITGTAGAVAICMFFSSNKKNIDDFLKKPSIRRASNILLVRQKNKAEDNENA